MELPLPDDEVYKKLECYPDLYVPGHSIDCVVLGFRQGQIQVLLLEWRSSDIWGIPGGFIGKEETLEAAARRVLEERTGLGNIFLRQFHTFGGLGRRRVATKKADIDEVYSKMPAKSQAWLNQRFITTGYYALVDAEAAQPRPDYLSSACEWRPVNDLPMTMMDHAKIIQRALDQIRVEIKYLPLGGSLLSEPFTLVELREMYEAILGESLDRGNFQRKMLRLGHLIRTEEKKKSGGAHRAPYLYRFNWPRYRELLDSGIGYL